MTDDFFGSFEIDTDSLDISEALEDTDAYDRLQAGAFAVEKAITKYPGKIPVIGDGVQEVFDITKAGSYYAANAVAGNDTVDKIVRWFGF